MSTVNFHSRSAAIKEDPHPTRAQTTASAAASAGAVRPPSRAAKIAAGLEEAIIAGRLGSRQRLIELDIAASHGVSRAPVREALQSLEREGLVVRSGRGFEVAGISVAEAADVFEILAHLEELYTRKATPFLGKAALRTLRSTLVKMEDAVRRDDVAGYYALNIRFHQVIRDACPNRPLIALLEGLGKKTLRLRRLAMSIAGRMPVSLVEHQRIVALIEAGDGGGAGLVARHSAEQAYALLAAFLRDNMLA